MRKPVLNIKNLKVAYSRVDTNTNKLFDRFIHRSHHTDLILKSINLSVYEGEILGLVGESGCGKSVTVKSIFGMVNFFPGIISGEIEYFDSEGDKVSLLSHLDEENGDESELTSGTINYREFKHFIGNNSKPATPPESQWSYTTDLQFQNVSNDLAINSDHMFRVYNRKHILKNNLSGIIENNFKKYRNAGKILAGKEISIILQDPLTFLNPYWSIKSQIKNLHDLFSFGEKKSKIKGVDDIVKWQVTKKILKDLRIDTDEFLNKIPSELSGGQAQRVMIVLSRMSNPELLIADEPTTGLDVTLKKRVVDFFRERKKPMIFISHDLNMVRMVSDRINIMYNGEIVENCDSDRFLPGFSHHPFTEKLISVYYTDYEEFIEEELPTKTELKTYNGCAFALQGCPYVKDICKSITPPAIDMKTKQIIDDNETEHQWVKCWEYLNE
jgi:peptide/nickel transport system ATP-binding protein